MNGERITLSELETTFIEFSDALMLEIEEKKFIGEMELQEITEVNAILSTLGNQIERLKYFLSKIVD